jgi:hypothetical protein
MEVVVAESPEPGSPPAKQDNGHDVGNNGNGCSAGQKAEPAAPPPPPLPSADRPDGALLAAALAKCELAGAGDDHDTPRPGLPPPQQPPPAADALLGGQGQRQGQGPTMMLLPSPRRTGAWGVVLPLLGWVGLG